MTADRVRTVSAFKDHPEATVEVRSNPDWYGSPQTVTVYDEITTGGVTTLEASGIERTTYTYH